MLSIRYQVSGLQTFDRAELFAEFSELLYFFRLNQPAFTAVPSGHNLNFHLFQFPSQKVPLILINHFTEGTLLAYYFMHSSVQIGKCRFFVGLIQELSEHGE